MHSSKFESQYNIFLEPRKVKCLNRYSLLIKESYKDMIYCKLMKFGWKVLMRPPYNPDLASFEYHLFHLYKSTYDGKNLSDRSATDDHLVKFSTINHGSPIPKEL